MVRSVIPFSFLSAAAAQQAGTLNANYHMPLPIGECTASGCTTKQTKLTLDSNWRWTHKVGQSQNCYTGNQWDTSICSSADACAQNCAVGGVPEDQWTSIFGIHKKNNGVQLDFVTASDMTGMKNVGSRMFVMEGKEYKQFNMLNKELRYDVDVSKLECGMNGAIYFVEMDPKGHKGVGHNRAGAEYGTGYCDGQCAQDLKWIHGTANNEGWQPSTADPYGNVGTGKMGACCAEVDIWETNKFAMSGSMHPSEDHGYSVCNDETNKKCGSQQGDRTVAPTDRDGCDMNPYRLGQKKFFGPGSEFTLDSTKKITVVTEFHAPHGELEEIKQYYEQDGKRVDLPSFHGVSTPWTDDFCDKEKALFDDPREFQKKGKLKGIGEAFKRGMTLVISLWDEIAVGMTWLDSVMEGDDPSLPGNSRGPCDPTAGKPEKVREAHPHAHYQVENIKWGDIGTTGGGTPSHLSCDECSAHGFGEDKCDCGYCGSFGGCGWTCGNDPHHAPQGPQCEKTIKCSECTAHGFEADQCGCGYCGSFGGCGWTCGHDASQPPKGPKCSVGSVEV